MTSITLFYSPYPVIELRGREARNKSMFATKTGELNDADDDDELDAVNERERERWIATDLSS